MAKKSSKNQRKTLLEVTIELLRHRDNTVRLEDLAKATDCSPAFLSSLLSPSPPRRPGVNAIQRVYEFLSKNELQY